MVLNLPLISIRQHFWRDSSGAVAVLFALSVPVLLGFAGLGIEIGTWLMNARAMQGVADAAATSAAIALNQTSSCTADRTNVCTTEADTVAAVNGWQNGVGGVVVTVNNPPKSGNFTTNNNAVEVIIQQPGTNWFSSFLPNGYAAPTLGARSVALANPAVNCMLSLNNTVTAGINFALLFGNINMPHCSIADDSLGGSALEITGFLTTVNAWTATVAGSINSGFLNSFNFTQPPNQGKGTVTPDPYACPGAECRTMPPATVPTALTPSTVALPTTCTGNSSKPITGTITLVAGTCYQGPNLSSGSINIATGACTSGAPCTIISPFTSTTKKGKTTITYSGPAIGWTSSGTLNITGGGSLTILGGANYAAINVTAGTVNITAGTNIIQGGAGAAGLSVSGGTVTIDAAGNTIQGGSGHPAISVSGTSPGLTFGASNNNILAGAGSPAIVVAPTGGSGNTIGGRLTFGNGNNNIQGAASDDGKYSAMTIGGFGHVVFGNGNTIFGGPTITSNIPAVTDQAGFFAGTGLGLVLGSGTFQFMEGISVTGGDLTLNPPGTSGGIGYYIMDGGGSTGSGTGFVGSGFNMTFGDLIGTNATIVLTGGAAGGVAGGDYANINFNGADGMTLTAPTTAGTWNTAGIAIFQDRAATTGNANTVYGISFDNITGAIYTPSQPLNFEGITLMNSPCTQFIADTITIWGLAFINDQCQGIGVATIGGGGAVTLVE